MFFPLPADKKLCGTAVNESSARTKGKNRNYVYRFLHYLPKKGKKSTRAFIIRFNSRTLILHISEFDSNPVSHFIFVSRLEPQELKCSLVLSQMYFR